MVNTKNPLQNINGCIGKFSYTIKSFLKSPDFQNYSLSLKKIYYIIFFILPFLAIYEIGLSRGVLEGMNAGDAILRMFLYFLYGILGLAATRIIFAILIVSLFCYLIYYLSKNKIKIEGRFLFYMLLESMLLALVTAFMVYLGLNYHLPKIFTFQANEAVVEQLAVSGIYGFWGKLVASIGAGIFEELVFRVILLGGIYFLLKNSAYESLENEPERLVRAVILSSIIFTLMHMGTFISGSANPIFGLISVFFASVVFSGIYLQRGYAIAAGTHIFYDIYLMFGIIS